MTCAFSRVERHPAVMESRSYHPVSHQDDPSGVIVFRGVRAGELSALVFTCPVTAFFKCSAEQFHTMRVLSCGENMIRFR